MEHIQVVIMKYEEWFEGTIIGAAIAIAVLSAWSYEIRLDKVEDNIKAIREEVYP